MRLGPTVTIAYHKFPLINTSQTQTLFIPEYHLSSYLQGSLEFNIDIGNEARVCARPQGTHVARFELENSLFELREASSLWSFKVGHGPETKTA